MNEARRSTTPSRCLAVALLALAAVTGVARATEGKPAPATTPAGVAAPPPSDTAKLAPSAPHPPPAEATEAEVSLWHTEEAFAASFAARDAEKFASFLDENAVFAGRRMLRGKAAIKEAWTKMMMSGPAAPFSWRPSRAVVSGDVGTTSGPVYEPDGKWSGSFASVWRRQPDGSWRIVLDGAPPCEEPKD